MVDMKKLAKFEKLTSNKQQEMLVDRDGIADTMRCNLASDIIAGYGMNSVVRQMTLIQDYEETTAAMRASIYAR